MTDCRRRYCGYCGMTPCVGDRCPQWDDDADDDDGWDAEDWGDERREPGLWGVCVWCGDGVTVPGEDVCEHCEYGLSQGDD